MEDKNKDRPLNEHLREIKYKTSYKINESPRYRPLVDGLEEYDEVPDANKTEEGLPVATPSGIFAEAGEQEDPEKQGLTPTEPSNDQPVGMNPDAALGSTPALPDPEAGIDVPDMPLPPEGEMSVDPAMPSPEQEVDTLQNDIIKHNVEAMKSIHNELEGLVSMVQGLNSKMDELNAEVEEVREPTDAEKLMSKKNVSYPYYFNLNDFWDNNWFEEQRNLQSDEGGIREMPDGTYIADFDDLPQKSKTDIQDSFND